MPQTFFGIATVAYLCLGAAGAGLASITALSYLRFGARFAYSIKIGLFIAFSLMLAGAMCLLLDLGRPMQVFNLILLANIDSWAARGFWLLLITMFIYALLLIVISRTPFRFLSPRWNFYKQKRDRIALVLSVFTVLFSIGMTLYTGFLLYEGLGVLFWRTLLLPILFFCGSMNIGLCLFLWINAFDPLEARMMQRSRSRRCKQSFNSPSIAPLLAAFAILLEAVLLTLYIVWARDGAFMSIVRSVEYLLYGQLAGLFWIGVVCIGLLLPFIVALLQTIPNMNRYKKPLTSVASLGTVVGLVALRYGIVFSGFTQY